MTMFKLKSILDLLIVSAVGVLVTSALNWYPSLPKNFVIHMNGAGHPDGWAQRSALLRGLLPTIGVAFTVGLQALVRWLEGSAAKNPSGINLPQREKFLALPIEGRRKVLAPIANYLRVTAVLLLSLFIYIVEGLGRLSTGASVSWSPLPVFVFVGSMLMGVLFLMRSISRAMNATTGP